MASPFHRRQFLTALIAGASVMACGTNRAASVVGPASPATRPRTPLAPLTEATFARRRARAAKLVRDAGGSALLVTSGTTNFAYLTGARVERSERVVALVVPVDGEPLVLAPSFEIERLRGTLRIARFVPWDEKDDPFQVLRASLSSAQPSPVIVVEPHTEHGTASALLRAWPEATLKDGAVPLDLLRAHKDEDELARMRRAITITEEAFDTVFDRLRAGMRDRDVEGLIELELKAAGVEGYALVQFGALSAQPHGHPRGDVLGDGTAVLIDGGCRVDGYWSDITRTRWFGAAAPQEFQKIYDVVHAAQAKAIAAVRPGVAAQHLDRVAREVISSAGYGAYFTHRLGHGLGMDGHEPVYLVEGNERPLEEGFVFTIEPGIYLPGRFGVRLEDDILCTARGAELLSRGAPTLPHA